MWVCVLYVCVCANKDIKKLFYTANLLLIRWERAKKVAQISGETLNELLPEGECDNWAIVQMWLSEEVKSYECATFIAASKSILRKYGYCDKLFCLVCRTKPVEDYLLSHTSYLLRLTVNYTHIIFYFVWYYSRMFFLLVSERSEFDILRCDTIEIL